MSVMLKTLSRSVTFAAAVASALLLVTPAMPAGAAGSSLSHSGKPTTVADGGTVDLTVTAPLYGAGTATRWLQEKIDPSRVHLTSASQIKAPEGWKVQYSTDGTSFTDVAPSTPEAWGHVEYVRARGSLTSGGIVGGKQAVTTTQAVEAASGPGAFPGSPSGDGFDAVFDQSGHVFNLNHHARPARIECRMVATGANCPGQWPWVANTNDVASNNFSYLNLDLERHHLWFSMAQWRWSAWNGGGIGMVCLDLSAVEAPGLCGGSWSAASVRLTDYPPNNEINSPIASVRVGTKVYSYSLRWNQLLCMDMAANGGAGAPCPNEPYAVTNTDWNPKGDRDFRLWPWVKLMRFGSEVVFANGAGGFCFDARTDAACAGWANPVPMSWVDGASAPTRPLHPYPQFGANGAQDAVCFYTWDQADSTRHIARCLGASGASVPADPNYVSWMVSLGTHTSEPPAVTAGKIYYASNLLPSLSCFDTKTRTPCSGWDSAAAASGDVYTVNVNPFDPSCLFVVTDRSGIKMVDADTGALGCTKALPTSVTLDNLAPSLGCSTGASSWSRLKVEEPTLGAGAGVASATLDVTSSSGSPVPGWQGVAIPTTGIVNLAQLPVAMTGAKPSFTVHLNGMAPTTSKLTATLTSLGNSPQLCISPTVSYACPGGYAAIPTLPNVIATILATDDTAVAPGVGVDVTVRPSNPQTCTGAVAGTVLDTSGNPVPGLPVSITGPYGTPVQLNGSDYTTTTKADGTYSFPGLRPDVAYTVTFPDTSVATAVSATVPSGDGAGTTTAADGSVTSNAAGVTAGATTIIDALYTQLIDLTPDAEVVPKNTTTTLHPLANDEPATGNTLVASSVKLCGLSEAPPACTQSSVTVTEGTFVANPDGTVDFTPATDFTGVVTPVTYQASDTGPTTGSAVINVTVVGAPTAQPVTSIDDVNVTQTLTPLSGATVDPAAGWASTPLLLCGASESAGSCTQSSVSVDGVGVYTVTPDNEVSFVPAHNYVGSPTPVTFDVVDTIGQRASSTLAVTVRPTIPEVPSSPSVTAGTTSATLSFDVPAWDGGSPVLSYLVEDGPGKHSCTVTVSGPGPYSCTVTGLVPGKVYGFVITATNAVGTGPEAAVSTRVGVLACTPGTYVEQRLGLLQSTTDFTTWTTLGQENGFVNAIAYRPADGFLYGIGTADRDLSGPENHLMRVAGDGSVTDLGVVEGLPATRSEAKFPAGAFDPFTGHLVVGGRGHLYSIDVDTHRATAIALPDGVSRIGWDLVIEGEWLWTVTSTQVVGINLSTDESVSYDLPGDYQSHGYGSVWPGTDDSSLFFQSNATGDITKVTGLGSSPSFSKVGNLPSAPRNDGAACPGAPS